MDALIGRQIELVARLDIERLVPGVEIPNDPVDPLADLTRAEGIARVRRAVLSLPLRYREVVVLCDLQELSYAEAAEALACAVGTVRSRLHRGRQMLATKLSALEGETSREAPAGTALCTR